MGAIARLGFEPMDGRVCQFDVVRKTDPEHGFISLKMDLSARVGKYQFQRHRQSGNGLNMHCGKSGGRRPDAGEGGVNVV